MTLSNLLEVRTLTSYPLLKSRWRHPALTPQEMKRQRLVLSPIAVNKLSSYLRVTSPDREGLGTSLCSYPAAAAEPPAAPRVSGTRSRKARPTTVSSSSEPIAAWYRMKP